MLIEARRNVKPISSRVLDEADQLPTPSLMSVAQLRPSGSTLNELARVHFFPHEIVFVDSPSKWLRREGPMIPAVRDLNTFDLICPKTAVGAIAAKDRFVRISVIASFFASVCSCRIIPPAVGVLPRGCPSRAQDFQLCQDQMLACRNKPPRRRRP